MKVSLNWVKEFTDVKLPVDELVKKIGAQLGEVEEVINLGERYSGIIVSKVVSCEKHPNADKLNVCKIDDGKKTKNVTRDEKGYVQVVCGAPNVRKGITVAWIPPGAVVPSSFEKEQFKLEARELRGVTSNGMLASGSELAINEDHDGILILDKPTEPGTSLAEVYKLDDYIIDIENKMFTHRPDCFGILGVAREIAGIQGIKFTSPDWYLDVLDKLTVEADKKLSLKIDNKLPDLVPRFIAIPLSGINVGKSPVMIQSFLSRVGIKPINNVVDITNFVMMLTGQPLHAYDYDKVVATDGAKAANLVVRHAKKGETITLLNGKTIEPRKEAIMIASAKELIGVAGVMGGTTTEVDLNTKNIILECANFDMYSIRRTSMEHGLFTDAVTRFNKGQSPRQNDKVIAYTVAWLQKLANGQVAGELQDISNHAANLSPVIVSAEFINQRLGLDLTSKQISKILVNVEFLVEEKKNELHITAPFWRTDISIAEDIVEEVGRLYGYDNLSLELPQRTLEPVKTTPLLAAKSRARRVLSAAGANEVLNYSFVHGNLLQKSGQDKELAYQLSNALSPDLQYYRLSLLPSLLDGVHANIKTGYGEFAVYEINKTHDKSNVHEDGLPIEEERLALVFATDKKTQTKYAGSAYYQAKKYLEALLGSFGIEDVTYEPSTSHDPKQDTGKQVLAPFERTRTAYVKTKDGVLLGVIGEVKQSVRKNLKLPDYIAGFEVDMQMIDHYSAPTGYKRLSRFPKSQQDISLELSQSKSYAEAKIVLDEALELAAKKHGYEYEIEPLDIYQKGDAKTKTVTLRITLVSFERTLTTVEVNKLLDDLANAAKTKLDAKRI